jgi:hypothetical protein
MLSINGSILAFVPKQSTDVNGFQEFVFANIPGNPIGGLHDGVVGRNPTESIGDKFAE